MKSRYLALPLAALLMASAALQAAQPAPLHTLLVVPARLRMVQLAFDMQSLRQADVVSWRVDGDAEAPELFYWNGKAWTPITLDQFRTCSYLKVKPQKIIFLGLDTPSALTESTDLPGIARFETFDAAQLVNNLDGFYAFSDREWSLLSTRYGFMLRDVNARVREQNRYARPPPQPASGSRPAPVLFDKNPPPAEVIDDAPGK